MTNNLRGHVLPASLLYVPASKPQLYAKAMASQAMAVIIDLEDSVLPADKASARENLINFLADSSKLAKPSKPVWVRVNSMDHEDEAALDLAALAGSAVEGLLVPKIEHESFGSMTEILGQHELNARTRELAIVGLIETAKGLLEIDLLAQHPALTTFGIGRADLFADLRIELSISTASVFEQIALQVVVACAAAGLVPPVAPVNLQLKSDGTAASHRFYQLGFRSQTAIHPAQCAAIHSSFIPTDDQYQKAQTRVAAFIESDGTYVAEDGQFVDEAVIRHDREIVQRFLTLRTMSSQLDTKAV